MLHSRSAVFQDKENLTHNHAYDKTPARPGLAHKGGFQTALKPTAGSSSMAAFDPKGGNATTRTGKGKGKALTMEFSKGGELDPEPKRLFTSMSKGASSTNLTLKTPARPGLRDKTNSSTTQSIPIHPQPAFKTPAPQNRTTQKTAPLQLQQHSLTTPLPSATRARRRSKSATPLSLVPQSNKSYATPEGKIHVGDGDLSNGDISVEMDEAEIGVIGEAEEFDFEAPVEYMPQRAQELGPYEPYPDCPSVSALGPMLVNMPVFPFLEADEGGSAININTPFDFEFEEVGSVINVADPPAIAQRVAKSKLTTAPVLSKSTLRRPTTIAPPTSRLTKPTVSSASRRPVSNSIAASTVRPIIAKPAPAFPKPRVATVPVSSTNRKPSLAPTAGYSTQVVKKKSTAVLKDKSVMEELESQLGGMGFEDEGFDLGAFDA